MCRGLPWGGEGKDISAAVEVCRMSRNEYNLNENLLRKDRKL
jgi:hypothetical protein